MWMQQEMKKYFIVILSELLQNEKEKYIITYNIKTQWGVSKTESLVRSFLF
jgi:hypothetical protein